MKGLATVVGVRQDFLQGKAFLADDYVPSKFLLDSFYSFSNSQRDFRELIVASVGKLCFTKQVF